MNFIEKSVVIVHTDDAIVPAIDGQLLNICRELLRRGVKNLAITSKVYPRSEYSWKSGLELQEDQKLYNFEEIDFNTALLRSNSSDNSCQNNRFLEFDIEIQKAKEILSLEYPTALIQYRYFNVNQFNQCLKKIIEEFNVIDVLIFNNLTMHDKHLLDVNNYNNISIKYMSKENGKLGGSIFNFLSVDGTLPTPITKTYSAVEHGIIGFTRYMGNERCFKCTGIHFNVICMKAGKQVDFSQKIINTIDKMKNGYVYFIDDTQIKEIESYMY